MQYRTQYLCIIIMYAVHIGPPMFTCKDIWKDNGNHLTSSWAACTGETTRLSQKKQSLLIMQLTKFTNKWRIPPYSTTTLCGQVVQSR